MSDTIVRQQVLVAVTCPECGCLFAFPEHQQEELRKTHRTFYCPSGHKQGWYGPNEVERERDELRENLHELDRQLDRETRAHRATKGKLTKTRKRIAGGVCPCCHRSFVNLGRHMTTKHPDYAKETT